MSPFLRIAAIFIALTSLAHAQDFPTKPIKLIVPFPPGGPNDIIARVVAAKMQELIGQPIVIDNRGGAGGVIGTDAVAKAEPDGHTIAITSAGALAISKSLQQKVPYDSLKDLKPVTLVAKVPELLVVANNVPASTMKELLELAKSKPGKLNFASTGPGSMPHLAGELFKITAGIDIVHVPYKGAAPAVNDIIGQQVEMVFLDIPVLLPQVRSGKVKPIAIGSRERVPSLPEVPTTGEVGLPQIEAENWYGMVVPAATPPAVVAKLHKATVDALKAAEVKDKLAGQGAILVGNTPEEFAAYIQSEIDKWGKVAKAANIKPN
ncbi:Bug family tripartite tricarboxylate transporter substrate binding protein [Pseudorhodoplanes sinuspersici]|uniref:LacI family transcriptional regulator n=1 Tax=Pseudorhodoplanes sinuspersici TaxID=1235591 RepID=A0A1W6ZP39_9HYPH|nr:tripartite tricarboxylate transporter substrate binding protein [Pseudorhodoplanes sinuspersici]ARP99168.1 LacI family transcriptional regulator [Pseudorhodoplanes sinuspersici]RKE69175.1 tripartite-type tricarboxylate transporter receptor subunit TctC [Pseudorhodoplanes sinuspersici]